MDLRKLKTLIDLVAESGIAELEITEGDGKVRIVKSTPVMGQPFMMHAAPQPGPAYAPAAAPVAESAPAVVPVVAPQGKVVTSPMVGTFYRSPSPDKPPFVDLGQSVRATDHVCIIEAMKLLNEIEAGYDGVITQILAENGQAVEFGQPLFIIG